MSPRSCRASLTRGQVQDIGAIGAKLKVANVLTGSIQKSGQRVRVTATLTETDTGDVVWSERYDGTVDDVFELQEDVARKVVEALQVQFGAAAAGELKITDPGTSNRAAYQHYMLGRYEQMKLTRQSLLKAHEHLADAIADDPGYGRAWVLDGITWMLQRDNGWVPQEVCYEHAGTALDRAKSAGHVNPVPYEALWRWLDPALQLTGRELAFEALELLKRGDRRWHGFEFAQLARQLAGAGLLNGACSFWEHYKAAYPALAEEGPDLTWYGNTLMALGRFEKAIDHFGAMYVRQPSDVLALGVRAMAYSRTGQYAKAAVDLEALAKTFPRNFAQFYDLFWRRELDAARAYFDWMESQKNLAPLFKIWGCFLLGHIDRGLDYLEAANFDTLFLRVMCLYALTPSIQREVTSNPRYQALLDALDAGADWQAELLATVNAVEHLSGIHVAPDEDY